MTLPSDIRITNHVVEAYARFYPLSQPEVVRAAVLASALVETSIAERLAGRKPGAGDDRTTFWLHPERTGLFVVANRAATPFAQVDGHPIVITFLRFVGLFQRELAVQLYGAGSPLDPTCRAPWADAVRSPEPEPEPAGPNEPLKLSKRARKILGVRASRLSAEVVSQIRDGTHPFVALRDGIVGIRPDHKPFARPSVAVQRLRFLADRALAHLQPGQEGLADELRIAIEEVGRESAP